MKHGTMSLRDRAAAWAFALFSAAALLAVAAQVFLGARPLQGMLPPLDQVTEFYVSPSHEDMVRFTVEENGLVQALGELRVAWRGPYQAIRYERGQHTYHIDLFRTKVSGTAVAGLRPVSWKRYPGPCRRPRSYSCAAPRPRSPSGAWPAGRAWS